MLRGCRVPIQTSKRSAPNSPGSMSPLIPTCVVAGIFCVARRHRTSLVTDEGLISQDRSPRLTMKGWDVVEPQPVVGGIRDRCFVAMSFDPSLNDAYELGIR